VASGSEGREKLGVSRMCIASPMSQTGADDVRIEGLVRSIKEVIRHVKEWARIRECDGRSGIFV
jgi:hypothetical protein